MDNGSVKKQDAEISRYNKRLYVYSLRSCYRT